MPLFLLWMDGGGALHSHHWKSVPKVISGKKRKQINLKYQLHSINAGGFVVNKIQHKAKIKAPGPSTIVIVRIHLDIYSPKNKL